MLDSDCQKVMVFNCQYLMVLDYHLQKYARSRFVKKIEVITKGDEVITMDCYSDDKGNKTRQSIFLYSDTDNPNKICCGVASHTDVKEFYFDNGNRRISKEDYKPSMGEFVNEYKRSSCPEGYYPAPWTRIYTFICYKADVPSYEEQLKDFLSEKNSFTLGKHCHFKLINMSNHRRLFSFEVSNDIVEKINAGDFEYIEKKAYEELLIKMITIEWFVDIFNPCRTILSDVILTPSISGNSIPDLSNKIMQKSNNWHFARNALEIPFYIAGILRLRGYSIDYNYDKNNSNLASMYAEMYSYQRYEPVIEMLLNTYNVNIKNLAQDLYQIAYGDRSRSSSLSIRIFQQEKKDVSDGLYVLKYGGIYQETEKSKPSYIYQFIKIDITLGVLQLIGYNEIYESVTNKGRDSYYISGVNPQPPVYKLKCGKANPEWDRILDKQSFTQKYLGGVRIIIEDNLVKLTKGQQNRLQLLK